MDRIPWEERGSLGIGRAFADTLRASIRAPREFYALPPRDGSVLPAVLYGYLFELPTALGSFVYAKAVGDAELRDTLAPFVPKLAEVLPGAPELLGRVTGASALASLLLSPVSYLAELLLTAAVTWVGLRLTSNLRTSFGVLVRMLAYASWVRVFGLFAVTGELALSALAFLATLGFGSWAWLVAVRESQRLTTGQVVWASLVGGLVAAALGCVVGLPLLAALVVWLVSKIDLPSIAP